MDEINPNKYTAAQLRGWLQQLNLPTAGTKSALVLRLNNIPQNERGVCPIEDNSLATNVTEGVSECEYEDSEAQGNVIEKEEFEKYRQTVLCGGVKINTVNSGRANENEQSANGRDGGANDDDSGLTNECGGYVNNSGDGAMNGVNSGENDCNSGEVNNRSTAYGCNVGGEGVNIGEYRENNNEREQSSIVKAKKISSSGGNTSFALLIELLPEYDGSTAPTIFVAQVRNIMELYSVDISTVKAWLHAKPNYLHEDLNKLLDELIELFGDKENKLSIRRKFEYRKWQYNEDFITYYNDKVVLAERLRIPEDELIEYVIEGIPDNNLKIHANLQCFQSKSQFLLAFSKISLKGREQTYNKGVKRESGVRCYNCNCLGHYASECQKPKREVGACYGCGSLNHLVAVCPDRKVGINKVANEYLRYIRCSFNSNFKNYFYIECLMHTGSPASFVKESIVVQKFAKVNKFELSFFSLNNNKFKTKGRLSFHVYLYGKCVQIEILVVDDSVLTFDCVLGRDFLSEAGLVLTMGGNSVENGNVSKDYVIEGEEFERAIMAIQCEDKSTLDLRIGEEISRDVRGTLEELFLRTYLRPERPVEPETRCEIKVNLEGARPFSCRPRRLSYDEREKLQAILDDYLREGYIRPSESEYASPIVLVKKKTGELRMCVDYRTLNKMTLRDNYPIPLIDELLDRVAGKLYFTKLDLKNGFYHVFVEDESIKYTSFVTPLGQYEFLRMPFGLKIAPSVFQRFVNKVLADMVRDGKLIVYMDDIMVATKDIKGHLEILGSVFERLARNKLELRLDKCEFLKTSVKYLGYEINGNGVKADDTGLQAVRDFPVPTSVHSVRSFLGLTSYFRRFVKDFSIIVKPLSDLTKKDKSFVFGPVELEAFETLKQRLIQSPILALYDPKDETELHCDASNMGFGAILLQKKNDGKWHPVFYYSKRTSDAESRYHSFELETLAVLYALRRFRPYLQGKTFRIVTDCNSLTMTLNRKDMNPRIARWSLEFQDYDYILEHRPGSRMQHVDALSRSLQVMVIEGNSFEENLVICQNRDPKLVELKDSLQTRQSKMFEMRNGILYRKTNKDDRVLFCVPEAMENHVFYKYHDEIGHVGVDKMVDLISRSYWFPQLRRKALEHVQNCLKCIAYSDKPGKEEGFLNNIPKSTTPFDVVHIDHYGPVDNGRSLKHVLVVIDASTKFVRLYATKTTKTKEVVKHLKDYFRAYSRPRCIVSGRGTAFTSAEFQDFLREHGVRHVKVATGSPQANGQVERVNRSLGPMLAKLVRPEEGVYWDTVLDKVEYALNNTVHRAIGQHPSVMLFGLGQRGPTVDLLKECVLSDVSRVGQNNHFELRQEAPKKQEAMHDYNKKYYDKRRRAGTEYEVGDYVVIRNFDSSTGVSRKLIPKFRGPYRVAKVLRNDRYLLEDVEGYQQSRNPYKGVWAVGNIRPWFRGRNRVNTTRDQVISFVRIAEL